jgi:hypothetical protein
MPGISSVDAPYAIAFLTVIHTGLRDPELCGLRRLASSRQATFP